MIVMVESCMGGLVSVLFIEILGFFDVVDWVFVIYFNEVKMEMLGIFVCVIVVNGVVLCEVVLCMVENVLFKFNVDIVVFIIGIVGLGGSEYKLVGLVYFGFVVCDCLGMCEVYRFGDCG